MAGFISSQSRHRFAPDRSPAVNKAKEAVALFDAIHSVDRPSICEALSKEIVKQDKRPELFVQLNTGEEAQKAGIAPADADAFIAHCRDTYGLQISGLMCIPPVDEGGAPHSR